MDNLSNILKNARNNKGLTQRELAALIGKTKNVISNWENGLNSPDVDMIELLCGILDIPVEDIFKDLKKQDEKNDSPLTELSERELQVLSLFRKLPNEEQLKFIGRLETIAEMNTAGQGD